MRDVVSGHEGSQQMGDGPGLTAVRPEHECVHPPLTGKQMRNTYSIILWKGHIFLMDLLSFFVKYVLTVSIYRGEDEI